MPHLTVEYSPGIEGLSHPAALRTLNEVLMRSGEFAEADIKSRAVALACVAVGTAEEPRGFVHARLAIMSGRSVAVKKVLSQSLLEALHSLCRAEGMRVQLCVEICDIDRETYAKAAVAR